MSKKLGLDKISNHEDKIYVGTLKEILRRALESMEIENKRGWPGAMTRTLQEKFFDFDNTDYIRNIPSSITKAEKDKKNPYQVPIRYRMLYTLLVAAEFDAIEIAKFKKFDERYNPNVIDCAYAEKPYSLFQLIRPYISGKVARTEANWSFTAPEFSLFNKQIFSVKVYHMKGDLEKKWIRIRYKEDGVFHSAFFAEVDGDKLIVQERYSKLFIFFLSFRKKK